MATFIAVYLVVCLNAAVHGTCSQLPITDSTEQPLTMVGCLGQQGEVSAQRYWEAHPDLHATFQYGGWACRIGNKKAPDAGGA